jgi:hypothetical protein
VGVGSGEEERLEMEDVARLHLPAVALADVFGLHVAERVADGDVDLPRAAAGRLAEVFGDVVGDAADAEEVVDAAGHRHGEALLDALREAEARVLVGVGQPGEVDVLLAQRRHEPRRVGQGRPAVEHAVAAGDVDLALFPGGGHEQAGHQVVAVGVEHAARVGRELDGPQPALPRRLDPDGGLAAEHAGLAPEQLVGVVGVARERQRLAEGGDVPAVRDRLVSEQLAAEAAGAPELDLLGHQVALDIHVVVEGDVREAAVFLPQLLMGALFQLLLKSHRCHLTPQG